jgi:hypothetical protein
VWEKCAITTDSVNTLDSTIRLTLTEDVGVEERTVAISRVTMFLMLSEEIKSFPKSMDGKIRGGVSSSLSWGRSDVTIEKVLHWDDD